MVLGNTLYKTYWLYFSEICIYKKFSIALYPKNKEKLLLLTNHSDSFLNSAGIYYSSIILEYIYDISNQFLFMFYNFELLRGPTKTFYYLINYHYIFLETCAFLIDRITIYQYSPLFRI